MQGTRAAAAEIDVRARTVADETTDHDEVTDVHAREQVDAAHAGDDREAPDDDRNAPEADVDGASDAEARSAAVIPLAFDGATWLFGGFDAPVEGVFVATHDPLPVGAEADVVLVLPDGRHVSAHGRVALAKQPHEDDHHGEGWPGYGLRFVHVDDEGRRALETLAERRAPLFYPD